MIALEVECDPLEEMAKGIDPKTAALEHLELVVKAFHKTAVVALSKIGGDEVEPGVEQFEEGVEASQPAGFNLSSPGLDPAHSCRFGACGLKDGRQLLTQFVGLLKCWTMGKQAI